MRTRMAGLALLLALRAAMPASAAALTAEEDRIVASVKTHHDDYIALLEKLVNVNSGTLNVEGVAAIATMLRPEFEALGFTTRWIPMDAVGRAGHLVAEHRATGKIGKRILMIAHLDTVFEATSPFQVFSRKGDTAIGPGVSDIKGGVMVILSALRALKEAGALPRCDITVFLTGDEERPGRPLSISRRDLIATSKTHDLALDFEPAEKQGDQDTVLIGRRSSTTWRLSAGGQPGHSQGVGMAGGYGAIYELARIIDEFRRDLPEPELTYNTSLIAGGSIAEVDSSGLRATASGKDNVIAAQAVAIGDLRTASDEQTERVRRKMREIVIHHLDRTRADITFEDGYPAMAPIPASQALVDRLGGVNSDLGLAPLVVGDPAGRGAGDISFVAHDLPGLAGMGMAGHGGHAIGESADLTSLDPQAERTAVLIARLSR